MKLFKRWENRRLNNICNYFITQTILKAAASDILKDYEKDNLTNDKNWINAKNSAFINDRYSQYIKVYANV